MGSAFETLNDGPCRACPATVRWVVVASSGKRMPLDPATREDGNVRLDEEGRAVVVGKAAKARLDAAQAANGLEPISWYVAHFATCSSRR